MRAGTLALAALIVALAGSAGAAMINVTVTGISDVAGTASQSGQFEATDPDGDGVFSYDLSALPANIASTGRWVFDDWSGLFNPDPVISNSFNVTNLLAGTQTFVITVSTAIGPLGPTTVTGGSAQGGVTDTNGDGATLSTSGPGTAFYTALIDGGVFQTLYDHSKSVTVGGFLSGNLLPNEDFGVPIPSFPGPAIANTIGLEFQFDLTGLDRATGSGVFVVETPEPVTGLLLGLGFMALACLRRAT